MSKREELREYISQELVEHPITDYMHHSRKVLDLKIKSDKEKTDKYGKKILKHHGKAGKLYRKYNLQNYFGKDTPVLNAAVTHVLHQHKDPEAKENIKNMKINFKRHQKKIKASIKQLKKQGVNVPEDATFDFHTRYVSQEKMDKMQKDPNYAARSMKNWMNRKGHFK